MIKYFLQKFFFQIVFALAVIGFIGVFIYAYATTGKVEPISSVRPPAHMGKALTDGMSADRDLSRQHLSEREVATLVNEIVASSMSFTRNDYRENIRNMAKYFTSEGYIQYQNFLNTAGFEDALTSRNLRSGAYTEGEPLELNSLVQNGVYKWLFEVPVTVSFIPSGADTYEDQKTTPQNQRFTLRLQLTRVQDDHDPNMIRIEIWEVRPARR